MDDAGSANIHVEETLNVQPVQLAETVVVYPGSRLVEELIDEEFLYTDEVFLDENDFAGKRILIVTSNPLNGFKWMEKADEVVILTLDENNASQGLPQSAHVIRGNPTDLKYEDDYFDYVFVRDVSAHMSDLAAFVTECSRILKTKGSVVILSLVQTNHPLNNLFLAEHFEQDFTVIVEKHLEYFPRAGKQSIQKNPVFMYERMTPVRMGILIVRLEKNGIENYSPKPVPPLKVDNYSYSLDKLGLAEPYDFASLSDSIMADIASIRTKPDDAFFNLRENMDLIYSQLGSI